MLEKRDHSIHSSYPNLPKHEFLRHALVMPTLENSFHFGDIYSGIECMYLHMSFKNELGWKQLTSCLAQVHIDYK